MSENAKQQWIEEAYQELCRLTGEPANTNEEKNIRDWAESLFEGFYDDGDCLPKEAVEVELSYAD